MADEVAPDTTPVSEIAIAEKILQGIHDGLAAQAPEGGEPSLAQKVIAFALALVTGAPHPHIHASDVAETTQGPIDILGHNYTFTESLSGNLKVVGNEQE